MAITIKSKIVPGKDLGNPSAVKSLPEGQNRLVLGIVFGEVTKLVTRTMPTGQIYEGFGGTFEALPADNKLPPTRSGVLYLPDGFAELIRDPFKKMQEESKSDDNDGTDVRLQFGFEVAAVKDGNPQGYSWQYIPLGEPAKADPLATLRQLVLGQSPQAARIAAPVAESEETNRGAKSARRR